MPRHTGESEYHNGSLTERTRKQRKTRGHKKQSRDDKSKYLEAQARERSR